MKYEKYLNLIGDTVSEENYLDAIAYARVEALLWNAHYKNLSKVGFIRRMENNLVNLDKALYDAKLYYTDEDMYELEKSTQMVELILKNV